MDSAISKVSELTETDEAANREENRSTVRNEKWRKWGPYLADRQWATVREDYSDSGNAWDFFTHDMARSRAYRWGEEGIGGISDDQQLLCFAVALWNYRDPFIKERFFGLTAHEGNHGEDVKEYYYYLDNTPSHSYMKMLYKYPQEAFPYEQLVQENLRRSRREPEYELIDTGIFEKDHYFDVFIEYAKADENDILIRCTIYNRSKENAKLQVLPQLWFRNTWSWGYPEFQYKPLLHQIEPGIVGIAHSTVGMNRLYFDQPPKLLFCENETNVKRIVDADKKGYFKDGINEYVVGGNKKAVNPDKKGTKMAGRYLLSIPPGGSKTIRLRLTRQEESSLAEAFADFDTLFAQRQQEADDFYAEIQEDITSEDARRVQRQAFAGMLWSKQFYNYHIPKWLKGDPALPQLPGYRSKARNSEWTHLKNADIISMPDKWEYPWYAAWDLAFHCIPLAMIDAAFAKEQLILLTREDYMHPNGQLPAYEWNFSDVNPPVHAWATWRVYQMDKEKNQGKGDREFLEKVFHKLLINFTWWVNRHDRSGSNVFQGGFLGLDNIGVFDRSAKLPAGGYLEQADGTSWMAMYTLNLMRISIELAQENTVYEEMAGKFFEHFLLIAKAMTNLGDQGIHMWDEEDEFFYDVLQTPHEERIRLKVRSLVGLAPLFAVEVVDNSLIQNLSKFSYRLKWFLYNRPDLINEVASWQLSDESTRLLFSPLRLTRMKRLLRRMLDETEFLSDYGIRSLSRVHREHPYVLHVGDNELSVGYTPAESDSDMFGGNSNWRGPIWFPVNYLIIASLERYHRFYGKDLTIEYPTGSGKYLNLKEIADELSKRLCRLFLKDRKGERAVYGDNEKFQKDPYFRDYILFYEYFDGDNGRGVGASHQTGWTGLIADLLARK